MWHSNTKMVSFIVDATLSTATAAPGTFFQYCGSTGTSEMLLWTCSNELSRSSLSFKYEGKTIGI